MKPAPDLVLSPAAQSRLLKDVSLAYPAEACGALLGRANQVVGVHPLPNRSPDPRASFAIGPGDLEPLLRGEADGEPAVIGFYHSHPDCDPGPSARDIQAAWPAYWYVIVGIERGLVGPSRAWRIDG